MKNLKIYRIDKNNKIEKNFNKSGLKIVAGLLAIIALTSCFTACSKTEDPETSSIIQIIQEEQGEENKILKYIDVSEKLNDLNLDKYETNGDIKCELDSPETIEKRIGNINKNNLSDLIYLVEQEKLVNNYIYNTGYDVAHKNITKATKNYIGEIYGVDKPSTILINYSYQKGDGNHYVYFNYQIGEYYYERTNLIEIKDKKIKDAVILMDNTDVSNDNDKTDNSSYNSERNSRIKKTIIEAEKLNQEIINNDLYDEEKAKKIR